MSEKKYYFITGFPRSGSTLLSSILNQNPSCYSNISSSLINLFEGIQFSGFRKDIISTTENQAFDSYISVINSYYNFTNKTNLFNTSRGWHAFIGLIPKLFQYTKFIVCVRDIPSILNSYEHYILTKNVAPTFVTINDFTNPWIRLDNLFKNFVAEHYDWWEYIYYSPELKKHCIFLDYDNLINDTENTIKNLYQQLNIQEFIHDFNNLKTIFNDNELELKNEGLHKVYKKVGKTPTKWILPQGAVEKYTRKCFWKDY